MIQYDTIERLTSEIWVNHHLDRILNDFASSFGWHPSDWLDIPEYRRTANGHLLVEHGLENTAVITFLRKPNKYANLSREERNDLLGISYNNLVDWHIYVEHERGTTIFNRKDPPLEVNHFPLSRDNVENLRSEAFEQIAEKRPNPNLQGLDDALISTISYWKRNIASALGTTVTNQSLSALFNSIMFIRAIEDNRKRKGDVRASNQTLLDGWVQNTAFSTVQELMSQSFKQLTPDVPSYLNDTELLTAFDALDRNMVTSLLRDFYVNRVAPYRYDFSVMSKHALSRIYEHYVSILREEQSTQLAFFPALPKEEKDRAYGSVYTPQFIARFFARYLHEELPPPLFRKLRVADPACGSGIFLRTLLEMQCDPSSNHLNTDQLQKNFKNVLGVDVDSNACQATRLSLALLHLVLTDELPGSLEVYQDNAIDFYESNSASLDLSFDAVIANPPFVSSDSQSPEMRHEIARFLGPLAEGKQDVAHAFLKIGLQLVKPGGYGLFVLPHSFLIADSAKKIREFIVEHAWIRCLADLSAIRVFPDSSSYVVLLIFQRIDPVITDAPAATILKCNSFVGKALQETLEGRTTESSYYSIYKVNQEEFGAENWVTLPPTESAIRSKFASLPTLDHFLNVRQGFVSGSDDIFLIDKKQLPASDMSAFVPYLRDRDIQRYVVPKTTAKYFFYPFKGDEKIAEPELKRRFRRTWTYLNKNKEELKKVRGRSAETEWWMPTRPRQPAHMLRPKLVTPHLVLLPRFALDLEGKYAVSRSPYMTARTPSDEIELLKFFLAVLNSSVCHWYVATHSHKYSRGYSMMEVKTLSKVPVPRPEDVDQKTMRHLLGLVDRRLKQADRNIEDLESRIDQIVSNIFGLTPSEQEALGIGTPHGN